MLSNPPIHRIIARHRDVWLAANTDRADWFAPDAMKFFGTILPDHAFRCDDRIAFVTSEKNPSGVRAFTVRSFDWATGEVDTVGVFHGYPSKQSANKAASKYVLNLEVSQ